MMRCAVMREECLEKCLEKVRFVCAFDSKITTCNCLWSETVYK